MPFLGGYAADAMLSLDQRRPPVPPADLILRVLPSFDAEDIEGARWSFDVGGLNNVRLYERALEAVCEWRFGGEVWLTDDRVGVPRSLGDFERLLDFGCGCGRLLRHLAPLSDRLDVHGADIDAEMVEWLRANMPFGRYEITSPEPPLPYPDHHFDLIISHSVFTHIDERLQDEWLAELQRITRPGAMLLISVQGESTWSRTYADARRCGHDVDRWQSELETRGILFIADDAFVGSTHPDFYHSTIHAPWYVFEHWSRYFDVDAHLADGAWAQDLVVLRRRADGAAPSSKVIRRSHPGAPAGVPTAASKPALTWRRRSRNDRRAPSSPELQQVIRELAMLRAGLYEQGRRISVLGAQLRDEIEAVRKEGQEQ